MIRFESDKEKLNLTKTGKIKKDFKLAEKQGLDIDELKIVVGMLAEGKRLPEKYRDHQLKGNYKGHRECHIDPDWLLIYKISESILVLSLVRTGSHSRLYKE